MDLIFTSDIMILSLCLIFSAFFSGSETAITSIGVLKAKHLYELSKGSKSYLKLWIDHPGRIITTILVVNNVVNILASAVVTKIAILYSANYGVGIATGLTTFVILIFGEIIPKSFAKTHAQELGLFALQVIYYFYKALFPVVWLFSSLASFIIKFLGQPNADITPLITEEELAFLINEGESEGVLKGLKKDMISRIFEFDETKVREIMTPRPDVDAITLETLAPEAVKVIKETGRSRIPVCKDNLDNVVGVLFAKDLLSASIQEDFSDVKVAKLMREVSFVPESKTIIDVFRDLKKTKNHLAIVIDEHGVTAGIITMEDILEEIVGEIQDEYDFEEKKIKKVEKGVFKVSGSANIDECADFFEIDLDAIDDLDSGTDTVGGLVMHLLGRLPNVGDVTKLDPLTFEVLAISNKRIDLVKVEQKKEEAEPPGFKKLDAVQQQKARMSST